MRPRFTLARLLAGVLVLGLAFASLASPSQMWASIAFAVALASLPLALLNAVYARGEARAFWVGFAVCGSAYFTATLGPWFRDEFGPRMVTTAFLDLLYAQVAPAEPPSSTHYYKVIHRAYSARPLARAAFQEVDEGPLLATESASPSRWAAWTRPDRGDGVGDQIGQVKLVSPAPFRRIGNALLTLAVAALGGCYARHRCSACAAGPP